MRLEKNIYEKLLNIPLFGRQRVITRPSKWYFINPQYYMMTMSWYNSYKTNYLYMALAPVLDKLYFYFYWTYRRGVELDRGYIPDDTEVHEEYDLRRGVFYEHVVREACHPYQWNFFKYRRMRFFKVERGLQGFNVPDWVKEEAKKRTLADAVRMEIKWNDFIHDNFFSDITPGSHFLRSKFTPLELLTYYGLLRYEAWERYFLNEKKYTAIPTEVYQEAFRKPFGYDTTTDDGRRKFENEVNELVSKYPGMIVPEGEKFDFKAYYARYTLLYQGRL